MKRFLEQSLTWYRSITRAEQLNAEPPNFFLLDETQPIAQQILRLSFEFARADAAITARSSGSMNSGNSQETATSSDAARILALNTQLKIELRSAHSLLADLTQKSASKQGSGRARLKAAMEDTQSRVDLLESESNAVSALAEFLKQTSEAQTGNGDLASLVEELARTVPEISAASVPTTPSTAYATRSGDAPDAANQFGILGLLASARMLDRELHIVDDTMAQTSSLLTAERNVRNPIADSVNQIVKAGMVNNVQLSDLPALEANKAQLDALTAQVNEVSPVIVALDKQDVLLGIYRAHLAERQQTILQHSRRAWKKLLIRSAMLASIILIVAIFGRALRHVAEKRLVDADRQRITSLVVRSASWLAVCGVCAVGLGAEWKTLATFVGLLTAGLAVALQNVILATLGYFLLGSRRGIKIGDRIQFSGITGDVIDLGLLQFQLKEYDANKHEFTGRVATFSNSCVFVSPAVGLVKMKSLPGRNRSRGVDALPLSPLRRDEAAGSGHS